MDKTDLSNYEEITDLSFGHEGAHLAVCHKTQNGSANGWHQPLILKADNLTVSEDVIKALHQVTVKLSFQEFVKKFFDMYGDDAEMLAKMLGFQTEYENMVENGDEPTSYQEYLEAKTSTVEILRSAESLADISSDKLLEIISLQKSFEDGLEQFKETSKEIKQETKISKTKNEVKPVDIKEILKSAEVTSHIQAEITKAVEAAQAAKDAEITEAKELLTKATEELEVFKAAQEAQRKENATNFVKSLTFVTEDNMEALVEAVLKVSDIAEGTVIVSALEAAQEAVTKAKDSFVESDAGVETTVEQAEVDKATSVSESILAKYKTKKAI